MSQDFSQATAAQPLHAKRELTAKCVRTKLRTSGSRSVQGGVSIGLELMKLTKLKMLTVFPHSAARLLRRMEGADWSVCCILFYRSKPRTGTNPSTRLALFFIFYLLSIYVIKKRKTTISSFIYIWFLLNVCFYETVTCSKTNFLKQQGSIFFNQVITSGINCVNLL